MSLILICYSWLSIETSLKLFFTKDMLLLSVCFAYTGKKCYILVASLGRILDSVRGVSSLWVCLRDFQNHLATLWSFFSEWEKGGSIGPPLSLSLSQDPPRTLRCVQQCSSVIVFYMARVLSGMFQEAPTLPLPPSLFEGFLKMILQIYIIFFKTS